MANTNVSHGEAKSICDGLEISPSQHQPTSPIYSRGAEPTASKKAGRKASADKGAEKDFGTARNRAAKNVPRGS